MKYIKFQENLKDKKILLRLDLNVPIKNGVIKDETRINKILPIINFLLKKKSKILIISHIGRPKGKIEEALSLKPICENLKTKVNQEISLIKKNIFELKKEDYLKTQNIKLIFWKILDFIEKKKKMMIIFQNI